MSNLLDGSALLPTPPPDDATAYDLIQKYDSASPEEQATIQPQLKAYTDAQDAAAATAQDQKWQNIYSGTPKDLGNHSAIKNDPELLHSTAPEETAAGAANMAYLSATYGKSMDELSQNWHTIRSAYALNNHGQDVKSDTELFPLIAKDVAHKKDQTEALSNLAADAVVQAFADTANETPATTLDNFNAWKQAHADAIQGLPEATLLDKYKTVYEATADRVADLAPQAKTIFETLASQTGRPDAPAANPGDIQKLAASLQDIPASQRMALYTVAQVYATRTGQDKGFWTQMAESLGRGMDGLTGDVSLALSEKTAQNTITSLQNGTARLEFPGTAHERLVPMVGNQDTGSPATNLIGPSRELTPEETQAKIQEQQDKLKSYTTLRELRQLATQGIDPIKPTSDWMNHSLEQGLYGAAGSLPLMGAALIPGAGMPLVGTAIWGQEYNRMRLAYPNLSSDDAGALAAVSAAPQTFLMNLRAGAVLGDMPVLGNYLKTLSNPQMNPIIRGVINTAGQTAEQGGMVMAQSAVPMIVDGLAKAAGADMPQYNLQKALDGYTDSLPETLFSVLPFALIGAGMATHADFKRGDAMTKSAQGLREAGYSPEEADRISKIEDPDARSKEITATWDSRTPENIKSGAELIAQRIEGDVKTQADSTTPTLRSEDEMKDGVPTGNKIFTVLDEQGNQKIQTTDPEAAVSYYHTAASDAASTQRSHLRDLLGFFQSVDQSQGRERTYSIDTKTVTAQDEAAAGQSTKQIEERMAQEGIAPGTPLDQVVIKGKTTPDLSRQIYSDTVQVLDGRADTMVHERLDGEVMAALHEGRISQDQFLEWCKQTESATGTKWLPESQDGTYSAQQIRETVTKIGEAYLAGRIRKIESIPTGLRGMFKAMLVYFQHVLAKAKVLRSAIDAGQVPQEFHHFLAKSVGLPEEAVVENHSARTTAETVRGVEQATAENSYSLGKKSITPTKIEIPTKGAPTDPYEFKDYVKGIIAQAFQKKSFKVKNYGDYEVDGTAETKSHALYRARTREQSAPMLDPQNLVENAHYLDKSRADENKKDGKKSRLYRRFLSPVQIGNDVYASYFTVREPKTHRENAGIFREFHLGQKVASTPRDLSPTDVSKPSEEGRSHAIEATVNIDHLRELVKSNDTEYHRSLVIPEEPATSSQLTETGGATSYSLGHKDEQGHGMPHFYSTLERLLDSKIQGKNASPDQVRGLVNGNNGVKAEEIKWSGIHGLVDRLAQENGGKIPKDALLEALRNEGRVQFKEHVLTSDTASREKDEKILEDHGWSVERNPEDPHGMIAFQDPETMDMGSANELMRWANDGDIPMAVAEAAKRIEDNEYGKGGNAKFQSYVLPGGENYREMVLAMDSKNGKAQYTADDIKLTKKGNSWTFGTADGITGGNIPGTSHTRDEAMQYALQMANSSPSPLAKPSGAKSEYTSSHFSDIPNYVAHMRMNDRVDSQGRPGLFVEEFQSDRHQQGRDKGYAEKWSKEDADKFTVKSAPQVWEVYDGKGNLLKEVPKHLHVDNPEGALKAVKEAAVAGNLNFGAIPDAPFRNDWHVQLFKRTLREAVATGKKWVGWTTGETQAERYDLSKQVSRLETVRRKGEDGNWTTNIVARDHNGRIILDEHAISDSKLADTVGKDLAEKISQQGHDERVDYSGPDLKVGGEGMKGFYDKKVVNDIGKYVDRLGKGKVEKDGLPKGKLDHVAGHDDLTESEREGFLEQATDQLMAEGVDENADDLMEQIDERARQLATDYINGKAERGETTPFWKVEITPEMEKAVSQGQASYSLTTKAEQARLDEALQRHLNRSPEARLAVFERMKANLDRVIARNNLYLADRADASKADQRYANMLQSVGELEAVIKALPMEIRGKIGGYREILSRSTDEGRTTVLVKRIAMADKALEGLLKEGYDTQLQKILNRSTPKKNAPGEKPKGIGAGIQRMFSTLKEAIHWTPEEARAQVDALQAKIDSGELSPQEEAHAQQTICLVSLLGDWKKADSVRRSIAVKAVKNAWEKGYMEHVSKIVAKREYNAQVVATLRSETGKEGTAVERQNKVLEANGLSGWFAGKKSQAKSVMYGILSFDQVLHSVFGDKSAHANQIADMERRASNTKEDSLHDKMGQLRDFFTSLAKGDEFKGRQKQWEMSQPTTEVKGTPLEGVKWSQNQLLAATMMWMQEDGRRHMEGRFDENGKRTSSWGYTQADIDKIEARLTPESKALRSYLLEKYAAEHEEINRVYKELNNVDLPNNDNYSPLTVKPQNAPTGQVVDPETGMAFSGATVTPGSLRTRGNSIAEPDFHDVLQTYISHTKKMEHYKAYAPFLDKVSTILRNRELRNSIEASGGKEAAKALALWMDYHAQGGTRDAASGLAVYQGLNKGFSRLAQMAIVGHMGIPLLHSLNLGSALSEMPTGAYIKRLGQLFTGQLSWVPALKSEYIQRRIEEMPEIAKQAMQGLDSEKPTIVREAVRKMGHILPAVDGFFTAGVYAMTYDYHMGQAKELGLTGAAAEEYARTTAERATDRLSIPTRSGAKSLFENTTTNPIARSAYAFMSIGRKNLALTAYSLAHRSFADTARTLAYVTILNGLGAALIRSAWQDSKDDEENGYGSGKHWNAKKLALAALTEPLMALPVVGPMINAGIEQAAGEHVSAHNLWDLTGGMGAAMHFKDDATGKRDMHQMLADGEKIMTTMGMMNTELAAFASLGNLAKDAFGIGHKATKAATGGK